MPATLTFDKTIRAGDRLLFLGDDFTQQMFYTRAVATALLQLKPDVGLRVYNGGRDGATAASALTWSDDIVEMTSPTVVFICFGLNDGKTEDGKDKPLTDELVDGFAADLGALVDKLEKVKSVRQVVIIGPPPVTSGQTVSHQPTGYNLTLYQFSATCQRVAAAKGLGYIDLFRHMLNVYVEADKTEGEPVTVGHMPNELGHTVAASLVLAGIGAPAPRLEATGWAPLLPRKMVRIRQALALPLKPPDPVAGEHSHELYVMIGSFDEKFFQAWRLGAAHRPTRPRDTLLQDADELWSRSVDVAKGYYGKG